MGVVVAAKVVVVLGRSEARGWVRRRGRARRGCDSEDSDRTSGNDRGIMVLGVCWGLIDAVDADGEVERKSGVAGKWTC